MVYLGVSYSLGDAIDWKPTAAINDPMLRSFFSYSLGDAIDWKLRK